MNPIYDKLSWLDFAIVVTYLLVLLAIGYIASFKQNKKNETLFLANKSLNWYNIGFNMWGTNVGPSSLLTFAMIGFTSGITGANVELYAFLFLLGNFYCHKVNSIVIWGPLTLSFDTVLNVY